MKTVMKLSLVVATIAAFGTSVALADDQQLQNRLSVQQQQQDAQRNQKSTTIAVYADRHGVSQRGAMQSDRSETSFELRSNGHGQTSGAYVPAR